VTYDAVMFDLDGTLADTLADILAGTNHTLSELGRPTIDVDRCRQLVGKGAEFLVSGALGPRAANNVAKGLKLFRAYYAEHGLDYVRAYKGIPQLLDQLAQRRITMAILSNKPEPAVHQVVSHLFGENHFRLARGQRFEPGAPPLKPHPGGAIAIADEIGIPPDRWLYVGDTQVDMQTANAAGMFAVGVLWGFRDEAELREGGAGVIIRKPLELMKLIDGAIV